MDTVAADAGAGFRKNCENPGINSTGTTGMRLALASKDTEDNLKKQSAAGTRRRNGPVALRLSVFYILQIDGGEVKS